MSATSITGTGHVNGGPGLPCQVEVEQHWIDVTTNSPKPDESWTFTDAAGHFHAYSTDKNRGDRYPTLETRVEVVPCSYVDHDPDCSGSNITHWHCRICGEEVTPGTRSGIFPEQIPGRYTWSARLSMATKDALELHQRHENVSLRVEFSDGHLEVFGIAVPGGNFSMTSGQTHITIELHGTSALGQRKTTAKAPA